MAENLTNARIDQLPKNSGGLKPYFPMAIRNMDNGVTEQVDIGLFLPAPQSQNFEWDATYTYANNELVTNGGKAWQSTINTNVGIAPGTNPNNTSPAPWIEVNKAPSGFVFRQNGAYLQDQVFILEVFDGYTQLFQLKNITRPFVSSDFLLEYASKDWEMMSERGYLAAQKVAHGFTTDSVLSFEEGNGWVICTGTLPPLGIVKFVPSSDSFILLLLGALVKQFSGLVAGRSYYVQSDGSIDSITSTKVLFIAVSTTEAVLFTAGGSNSDTGGGSVFANKLQKYFTAGDGVNNVYTVVGYTVSEIFLVLVGSVPQVESANYTASGNSIDFTPSAEAPGIGVQILILFYGDSASVGTWILATGIWNDSGTWDDLNNWID